VYDVNFRNTNKFVINDDSKFCLWLKLNVGLIIHKEIQIWANKKILEDNNDLFF